MFGALLATVPSILLIGGGLILLPLPIPLGAIMILGGVALAVSTSPTARRWVRSFRSGNPRVEAFITRIRPYLPRVFRRPLDLSQPRAGRDDATTE